METSPVNLNILNSIVWTVLFGSVYSIVLLAIYGRKYPARRDILTHRIVERSWTGREAGAVLADIQVRDERDANRSVAPLRPAEDAKMLDTSELDISATIKRVRDLIKNRLNP